MRSERENLEAIGTEKIGTGKLGSNRTEKARWFFVLSALPTSLSRRRSYLEDMGIKKVMVVLTSVCVTGKLGSSTNREGAVILCVSRARLLDGRLSGLPGMDKQSNRGESAPELITPVIMA
jgi:hypothetical protein